MQNNYFRFNWVLVNKLAIGPAPREERHLVKLRDSGIKAILSLCSEDEAKMPDLSSFDFMHHRYVLPDHKSGRLPKVNEVLEALEELKKLQNYGPVFIHCLAAVERSPLICMGWLIKVKNLSPEKSLQYIMQVNSGTSPLPSQLSILKDKDFLKK